MLISTTGWGGGVWADGQDMQELLEDDLPGKLVQLESIRLPATGQDTDTAIQLQSVSSWSIFLYFGNILPSNSFWLIFYNKIKTFNYSIYSFQQQSVSPPACLC